MAGSFKRLVAAAHEAVAYGPRIEALSKIIARQLRETDHVLDVGCGNGRLAAACMKIVPGVDFHGLERSPRGGEPISVSRLEGDRFPFEDGAFDVVLLADVVHHEPTPDVLLKECRRVSRRLVLLKDHWHKNSFQYLRICALDFAANYAVGVRCLYLYGTPDTWRRLVDAAGLAMLSTESPLRLYRQPFEALFGGSLHFFAALAPKT